MVDFRAISSGRIPEQHGACLDRNPLFRIWGCETLKPTDIAVPVHGSGSTDARPQHERCIDLADKSTYSDRAMRHVATPCLNGAAGAGIFALI
jgi:hypothetical protein